MLDKISDTAKWISATVGAVMLVGGISWGMAIWVTDKNEKAAKTDSLEILMKDVKRLVNSQGLKQDSLKYVVLEYVKKTDALQVSHIRWVQEHSKDINELTHSLEGMTFELVPPEVQYEKGIFRPPATIKYERTKPLKK